MLRKNLLEGQGRSILTSGHCGNPTYGSDTALEKATGNHSSTLPKKTTLAALPWLSPRVGCDSTAQYIYINHAKTTQNYDAFSVHLHINGFILEKKNSYAMCVLCVHVAKMNKVKAVGPDNIPTAAWR